MSEDLSAVFTPAQIIEQNLPHAGTTQAQFDGEDSIAALEAAGYVTIPRAQFEALMAATEELIDWSRNYDNSACDCMECLRRRKTIAALRAAGLHETEGGDS